MIFLVLFTDFQGFAFFLLKYYRRKVLVGFFVLIDLSNPGTEDGFGFLGFCIGQEGKQSATNQDSGKDSNY